MYQFKLCCTVFVSVDKHFTWTHLLCESVFTLNMVSSSSCCGVCRVACFHGILKRMASRSIHIRPGYRPLSTWATSQGFSRTRRGVTDILTGEKKDTQVSQNSADSNSESATAHSLFAAAEILQIRIFQTFKAARPHLERRTSVIQWLLLPCALDHLNVR